MNRLLAIGVLAHAVAAALPALGEVVTVALPEPLVIHEDFFLRLDPIDINGDAITDFTFASSFQGVAFRTERANRYVYRIDPPPNIGGPVASVPEGFQIGLNLTDSTVGWASSDFLGGYVDPGEESFAGIVLCLDSGCSTDFTGQRAFAGLEFQLDDGTHYGYFDLLVGDFPSATIYGWAYETTPGIPIVTQIVPEPDSLWLVGTALVLALGFWRPQRQAAGESH